MHFLADMGVSSKVVEWLRQGGHDAIHLRDEGLQKLPNGEIFSKAAAEKRIVITFDLDFGEIAASFKHGKCSVIIFRLRNARSSNVIDKLNVVLSTSSLALEQGAVILVEEARHRIRLLPIGQRPR